MERLAAFASAALLAACHDRGTGQALPDEVQVDFDGQRFEGCGDPPAVPVR